MGYGQWVGNESVHWEIAHEDGAGTPVALAAKAHASHPTTGHDVHIDRCARGCDPVALTDVGRRKGHSGRFRLTLRFTKREDAQEALDRLRQVSEQDGMYVVAVDVPVIRRKHADDAPPAEVRIDW
jgi:hypothetical protein